MEFQTPKGTRDMMQQEGENFQTMIDIIRLIFRKYGFTPLFTPAFEDFALLSIKGGLGESVKNDIYFFKDKSERELGLRFDLTMPMVRVVSMNPQIKKPFKRYAIGKVWRYDNPQAMRYREFWQADVDVVGSNSPISDAECLAVACECLEKLGFDEFDIRINNRKFLQDMFEKKLNINDEDRIKDIFRSIDKLEKLGEDGVRKELIEKGLKNKTINELMKFLNTSGTNSQMIRKLRKTFGDTEGILELENILNYSKGFGIGKRLKLDMSLVRGLDYYTGCVFEINLGEDVSCGGGGRYDKLIKNVGGADMPSTGISLGISRIFEIMKTRDMFNERGNQSVFVANVTESTLIETMKIANKIRKTGAIVETDLAGRDLKKQLSYANSVGADYSIIVGEEELRNKLFTLKNMKTNSELKLPLKDILKEIKKSMKTKQ